VRVFLAPRTSIFTMLAAAGLGSSAAKSLKVAPGARAYYLTVNSSSALPGGVTQSCKLI